jgi:electron transport complex protein RnfG
MREFVRMLVVLFVACGLAAASLAVVNIGTRARIAQWEKLRKDNALRAVCREADEFKELAADRIWEVRSQGRIVGHAFLTEVQGYSGAISLMFGVDGDGAITGLQILSHTETPGLGAKIASAGFRDRFRSKRIENLKLKKDAPGTGQIDAITGATISSRAVAKALYATLDAFYKENGGDRP